MTCQFAIQGSDTLVAQSLIELLIEADHPAESITLLLTGSVEQWSDDEEGEDENVRSKYQTQECFIDNFDFSTADILFSCGEKSELENILDEAINAGTMIVDLSGYGAQFDRHPLIVSSVNSHELQGLNRGFIVAVPSAPSAMLAEIIHPIMQQWELEQVTVSHLNPAANLGKTGVDALAGQTARLMNGMPIDKKSVSQQLSFSLIPQCGSIDDLGHSEQEVLLVRETKTLLNNEALLLSATCIQAPVFYAQSQVIDIKFADFIEPQAIQSLLRQSAGLSVVNAENASSAAIKPDQSNESIVISRIRQNEGNERTLTLWCAADSLRRCVAGNAVQIAEILIKSYL